LPEWLAERGIGETRFARVVDGEIVEARILVDGIVPAGTQLKGQLERHGHQLLAMADGERFLLPDGAHGFTDGSSLTFEVTREKIPGVEAWKLPLAKVVHVPEETAPEDIRDLPIAVKNELDAAGWDDLIEDARSGVVEFERGELRFFATPAMTLIDVDGTDDMSRLAIAAARAAARAILRLGIGGSIGIDFPTVEGKGLRQFVASEIDRGLPRPFERTAVNGFGFLQIIRPRRHASLLELAHDRASFEARALLRRAGRETGAISLAVNPAVAAAMRTECLDRLGKLVGGAVGLRSDPTLTMSAGHAEPA
jgi:hypothetical protein